MEMTITTPSLLFPAISLLLLAYTNRFVTLTNVIRQLSASEGSPSKEVVRRQIVGLRKRLQIIRLMQASGVMSFVFCTLSMFSFYEVNISTNAINIELEKFDEKH